MLENMNMISQIVLSSGLLLLASATISGIAEGRMTLDPCQKSLLI